MVSVLSKVCTIGSDLSQLPPFGNAQLPFVNAPLNLMKATCGRFATIVDVQVF